MAVYMYVYIINILWMFLYTTEHSFYLCNSVYVDLFTRFSCIALPAIQPCALVARVLEHQPVNLVVTGSSSLQGNSSGFFFQALPVYTYHITLPLLLCMYTVV